MKKFIFVLLILIGGIFVIGKCSQIEAYHLDETTGNVISDNILNLNDVSSTTKNGLTYSVSNGVLTINGTVTYTFEMLIIPVDLELNQNYSLSYFNDNYTTNFQYGLYSDNEWLDGIYNNSGTFTNTMNVNNIRLTPVKGTTFNNQTFKPMVVEGSKIPTQYEPYGIYYKIDSSNQSFDVSSATATWEGQSTPVDVIGKLIKSNDTLYFEDIIKYSDASKVYITINFNNDLSTNQLYVFRFKERIGSSIAFYQNDTMIYRVESEDCQNNICTINFENIDYSNFNKIIVTGTNQDYYPVSFSYFSNLYQVGYDTGYLNGNYDGYDNGYDKGYNIGYDNGQRSAELDIYGFLPGIIGAILSFFYTIMQFSVFGISLFDIFVLFFGISMVVLILKIINGGGD